MLLSLLASGNLDAKGILLSILYTIPAVLIALTFHEFAHAFAAYKLGDPTAKLKGRMTMDPTKHLSLIGTLSMFLIGWGWAKPVPINPRNFKKPRRDDLIVSVAGPLMNLFIAFAACGIFYALAYSGLLIKSVSHILQYIIILNVYLATFNLIPIPPLDGFHIISSLFIKKAGQVVMFLYKYGYIILLVLIFTRVIGFVCGTLSDIIITGYENFFLLFF